MESHSILKALFGGVFTILAIGFSLLLYFSYQDYVHPKHVYGKWIEVGSPGYNTEVLELSDEGVLRNSRLVATQFEFDGKKIYVKTGEGISVYQMSGTMSSPQLRRVVPNSPTQRFIKEGYEDTVNPDGGGAAKNRRAALSDHFNGN